jgi:hypothetical protein
MDETGSGATSSAPVSEAAPATPETGGGQLSEMTTETAPPAPADGRFFAPGYEPESPFDALEREAAETPEPETTEQKPDPAQPATPPKPNYSPEHYAWAGKYGFTPQELEQHGPDRLYQEALRRQQAQAQPTSQQTQKPASAGDSFDWGEGVDERLVKFSGHLNDRFSQMQQKLEAFEKQYGQPLTHLLEQNQRSQVAARHRVFSDTVERLSEKHYGKGTAANHQNRARVWDTAIAIQAQYPTQEAAIEAAHFAHFGKEVAAQETQAALKAAQDKARQRAGQTTAQPTQRKAPELTGRDRAVHEVAKILNREKA